MSHCSHTLLSYKLCQFFSGRSKESFPPLIQLPTCIPIFKCKHEKLTSVTSHYSNAIHFIEINNSVLDKCKLYNCFKFYRFFYFKRLITITKYFTYCNIGPQHKENLYKSSYKETNCIPKIYLNNLSITNTGA